MEHAPPRCRELARARPRPDFHQLALFLDVVATGSFTATARRNGCTQPAISQAIARLEDVFGGDLFERRRGAPLMLTAVGQAVLPSARTLLYMVDKQLKIAIEAAQGQTGSVSLGFSPGLAAGPLRAAMTALVEERPDVQLRLVEGTSSVLQRRLADRTADLVITAVTPNRTSPALSREHLWDEQIFLALPAHHALAARAELDWRSPLNLPVLLSTYDCETQSPVMTLPPISDLPFIIEKHAVSRQALLAMVAIGMGATLALGSTIAPYPNVIFRPLVDRNATVPIEAFWRTQDANPLRHYLLRHIRAHRATELHKQGSSTVIAATAPERDHDLLGREPGRPVER